MSQADEHVANIGAVSRWPLWTRLVVAAPGAVAAALVIAGGIYFAVLGFDSSILPDDDFASISVAASFFGIAACAFGLLIALAALVVTLRRPRRVPLVLTALFTSGCAALAAYLLATGADRIVYIPLVGVLSYLAVVAILRSCYRGRQSMPNRRAARPIS